MRKTVLVALLVLTISVCADAAQITGNYIEARTASVYVGACFANSEMNLTGREAVMGWNVLSGSWQGVPLSGLSVAGVVRGSETLGEHTSRPFSATSVVVVDERANDVQAKALVNFVRAQAPQLFANVAHVEKAPIEFQVAAANGHSHGHDSHGPAARLVVGDFARIVTRAISHEHDHTCANAELYYQPLTKVSQVEPAMTLTNEFKGAGLGSSWTISNRPSAYVGTFAR